MDKKKEKNIIINSNDFGNDINYLKPEQYKEFINYIKLSKHKFMQRNLLMLQLLLETGARIEEFRQIQLKDINFKKNIIVIDSKKSHYNIERILNINKKLMVSIKEYIADKDYTENDYLFQNRDKNPFTDRNYRYLISNVYDRIRPILQEKKIDLDFKPHPHTFRHTHIVYALLKGVSVDLVRGQVGHLHLSTTEIYPLLSKKGKLRYNEIDLQAW